MNFIDLSVELNENTPIYPGDPETKINPVGILEKDGYQDHYVCVGTHVGTHVDAPAHMISGGASLDQIPLDRFSGRGVYVRFTPNLNLNSLGKLLIRENDIVLFHSGMSHFYSKPEYYTNYPAISEEIANYLVSLKIKMVGVDMCSVDYEPFPVHRIFLRNNILIIENLTNLELLKDKQFNIYAFPPKLQLDGAPVQVVAEIL
jgi:kynurenine formamidase